MLTHSYLRKMLHQTRFTLIFLVIVTLSSCSNNGDNKQFEHAGGTFEFALDNEPTTFLARNVSDFYSSTVLNQIYEGLVAFEPTSLKIAPSLAEKWEVSNDGKVIKFTLRDDVYFHSHPQFEEKIKLTAEDVVFSIELACKPLKNEETYAYSTIYKGNLKGADDFFQGKTDEIEGLKMSGNIITLELKERDVNFLDKLAQTTAAIVSKKIVEAGLETDLIGTGPFKYLEYRETEDRTHIVLVKNNNYYGKDAEGHQLPYLDSLIIKIEPRNLRQLEMFEDEEILLIDGLPPSRISMMLGEGKIDDFNSTPPKLILIRKPLLATQYYHFNLLREEFKDVRVRKAINYAINRDAIVKDVLNNQAFSKGNAGIVPPATFGGYDYTTVKRHSYTYNPEKARALLAEAGYPDGKDFPDINLKFNLGSNHSAVADEVAKQLKKVLNINVNLDGMPFLDRLKDQENANGQLFRSSWYADFYSPESFLMSGYGGSIPDDPTKASPTNHARYSNPEFDAAFEKGKSATDIVERYKNFAEAERILMEDAPYIILWYEETIKVIYSKVRNLYINEMNHYTFKDVYIKDWTKSEWEESIKK